mmetsp:Transcript_92708/g.297985  ORF Transcript_92708/g.297985 Transcript_92708/m.297985 type:complete len:238 (-) Transcript_92708:15-728(-)
MRDAEQASCDDAASAAAAAAAVAAAVAASVHAEPERAVPGARIVTNQAAVQGREVASMQQRRRRRKRRVRGCRRRRAGCRGAAPRDAPPGATSAAPASLDLRRLDGGHRWRRRRRREKHGAGHQGRHVPHHQHAGRQRRRCCRGQLRRRRLPTLAVAARPGTAFEWLRRHDGRSPAAPPVLESDPRLRVSEAAPLLGLFRRTPCGGCVASSEVRVQLPSSGPIDDAHPIGPIDRVVG